MLYFSTKINHIILYQCVDPGSNILLVSYALCMAVPTCTMCTLASTTVLLTCMSHQTRATCNSGVTTSAGVTSGFCEG